MKNYIKQTNSLIKNARNNKVSNNLPYLRFLPAKAKLQMREAKLISTLRLFRC